MLSMKPKLIRILFVFSFITLALIRVESIKAQDAGPAETYEGNDNKEREPLYSPGEQLDQHHKAQSYILSKDTFAVVPKIITPRTIKLPSDNTKPETKQSADDSILSFNFLYYIIQKYKLQDIVE